MTDYIRKILDARVYDVASESPLDAMPRLSARLGRPVLLKREDQQPVRSYKIRGASNLIAQLDDDARARLGRLAARLGAHSDWTDAALAAALKDFAETEEVGFGKVGQPLRAALTGGAPAPDLSAVMEFLGKEESLSRIQDQCLPSDAA